MSSNNYRHTLEAFIHLEPTLRQAFTIEDPTHFMVAHETWRASTFCINLSMATDSFIAHHLDWQSHTTLTRDQVVARYRLWTFRTAGASLSRDVDTRETVIWQKRTYAKRMPLPQDYTGPKPVNLLSEKRALVAQASLHQEVARTGRLNLSLDNHELVRGVFACIDAGIISTGVMFHGQWTAEHETIRQSFNNELLQALINPDNTVVLI